MAQPKLFAPQTDRWVPKPSTLSPAITGYRSMYKNSIDTTTPGFWLRSRLPNDLELLAFWDCLNCSGIHSLEGDVSSN